MTFALNAIYENGVFRISTPLELANGTSVQLIINTAESFETKSQDQPVGASQAVEELTLHEDPILDEKSRQRLLLQFGQRAGWNDPEMDVYDDFASEQQP